MLVIIIKENKFISLVNRNMTIRLVPKTPNKQEDKNTIHKHLNELIMV